jgi:hypothetical protein
MLTENSRPLGKDAANGVPEMLLFSRFRVEVLRWSWGTWRR